MIDRLHSTLNQLNLNFKPSCITNQPLSKGDKMIQSTTQILNRLALRLHYKQITTEKYRRLVIRAYLSTQLRTVA
jgi:hypothetical protein